MEDELMVKFVVAGRRVYKLKKDSRNLWRDENGVIWALRETHATVDQNDTCGIWPFSLPKWHILRRLNATCARHDYMYSSPAFQYFNTRLEADEYLEMLIGQDEYFGWLGKPFKWISRVFGGRFWEHKKTR